MDLKYIQDEADLSVGLSVTCSTTTDDSYSADGALMIQQSCGSSPPLFVMNYTPENMPLSNAESVVHSPDIGFDQSLLMSEHANGINERNEFEDLEAVMRLDSCDLYNRKYKRNVSLRKTSVPYASSRKLHPDAHKMQVCKICGKTFKFQTSLLRHNNKVHISRYQCTTCCKVFSRQSYLDVHTSKPGTSCYKEQKVKIKSKKRH